MIRDLSVAAIAMTLSMALTVASLLYGRQQVRKLQEARVQLALGAAREAQLKQELHDREQALDQIRDLANAQNARIQSSVTTAQIERSKRDARAVAILTSPIPEADKPSALIRWATQEAQSLSKTLEAP